MRFTAFILITAFCKSVFAYPSGAGSCAEGGDAIGQTGESHVATGKPINTGPLSDGGFSVTLGDSVLAQFQTFTFPINTKTSLTINSSSKQFKGFLIRLGETGTMTDLAFDGNTDSQLKVSPLCTAAGVGGITHTTSDDKTTITAYLNLDAVAADMPLDVTIVVDNDSVESIYYYSRFIVSSIDQAPAAAPSATSLPTAATSRGTYPTCSVCGTGKVVTNPTANVDNRMPPETCEEYQRLGLDGSIDELTCSFTSVYVAPCACMDGTIAPAAAPSTGAAGTPVPSAFSPPPQETVAPITTSPSPVPKTATLAPVAPPVASPAAAPVVPPVAAPVVPPVVTPVVSPVVAPYGRPVVPFYAPYVLDVPTVMGMSKGSMGMRMGMGKSKEVMGMMGMGKSKYMEKAGKGMMGMGKGGMDMMGMGKGGIDMMGMGKGGMDMMGMGMMGMGSKIGPADDDNGPPNDDKVGPADDDGYSAVVAPSPKPHTGKGGRQRKDGMKGTRGRNINGFIIP